MLQNTEDLNPELLKDKSDTPAKSDKSDKSDTPAKSDSSKDQCSEVVVKIASIDANKFLAKSQSAKPSMSGVSPKTQEEQAKTVTQTKSKKSKAKAKSKR